MSRVMRAACLVACAIIAITALSVAVLVIWPECRAFGHSAIYCVRQVLR